MAKVKSGKPHPKWGATQEQGRRNQRERDRLNAEVVAQESVRRIRDLEIANATLTGKIAALTEALRIVATGKVTP